MLARVRLLGWCLLTAWKILAPRSPPKRTQHDPKMRKKETLTGLLQEAMHVNWPATGVKVI